MNPPSPPSDPTAIEEYRALRATIRERGTMRVIVAAMTFFVWPVLVALVTRNTTAPWLVLLPLVVLWAGFEVVYGLHVGVERVGRYVQLRYESDGSSLPGWEHAAMRIGALPGAATGADPLFFRLFVLAALLNLAPLVPQFPVVTPESGRMVQLVVSVILHAAFFIRLVQGRRFAAGQRAGDLQLFRSLSSPAAANRPLPPG